MERKIFISYSRRDLKVVKKIKEQIELYSGAKCWMDLEGIESGNPEFTKAIVEGINECEIFLFMLSNNSQLSTFALKELDLAYKKVNECQGKKKVVMVNIDSCQMLDDFYLMYSRTDIIEWNNASQREKLLRDLCKWIEKTDNSFVPNIELPMSDKNNRILLFKGKNMFVFATIVVLVFFSLFYLLKIEKNTSQEVVEESSVEIVNNALHKVWPDSIPVTDPSLFDDNNPYILKLFLEADNMLYAKGQRYKGQDFEWYTNKEQIEYGVNGLANYLIEYTTKDGINPVARMMLARKCLDAEIDLDSLNHEVVVTKDMEKYKKYVNMYYDKLEKICDGKLICEQEYDSSSNRLVESDNTPLTVLIYFSAMSTIDVNRVIEILQNCCINRYYMVL